MLDSGYISKGGSVVFADGLVMGYRNSEELEMNPKSLTRATKRMKLPSIVMGKSLGGADLRGKGQIRMWSY